MVPHPLPASLRLDTGEDIKARLEPRCKSMGDFNGLMHSVLCGEDAVLFLRGPLDCCITMDLEHGFARFKRLGAIHLNLKVALGAYAAGPPARCQEDYPAPHPLPERHTEALLDRPYRPATAQ